MGTSFDASLLPLPLLRPAMANFPADLLPIKPRYAKNKAQKSAGNFADECE